MSEQEELDLSDVLTKLIVYFKLGFTESCFDDPDWAIRIHAYRVLGYTEKAFDDEHWIIRREAYRKLEYTEKSLDDESEDIRNEAKLYFRIKNEYTKEELQTMLELYQLEIL